jgi:predicted secreted protein
MREDPRPAEESRTKRHGDRRVAAGARRGAVATALALFAAAWLSWPAPPARAQAQTRGGEPGAPLLRLEAQAQREVTDDIAVAVLFVERDGPQPAPLQSAVNTALRDALAELRRDGALQVRSGNYLTQPRYGREGRIEAWRVRGELVIESTDIAAVSRATGQLAGRMNTASIGFRLSAAGRAEAEKALTKEAADRFHQKARDAAVALGFSGFDLIEIDLNAGGPQFPTPLARGAAMAASAGEPVPVEPGRSQVAVTFNGLVRLKR